MRDRADEIEQLPPHQRPHPRELGRRSEAADHPFKAMRSDEVGGSGNRGGGYGSGSRPAGHKGGGGGASPPGLQAPVAAIAPLITVVQKRQKMVVAAADHAALMIGLTPGMALTHARALVPDLDVRDADPAADHALLDRIALFAVRRWTPTAMVDCGSATEQEDADDRRDGILMDLTGVAHLHGGETRMAERIIGFCARLGLEARVAVAGSIGAAYALARYATDRITICPPHGEAEALAPLPVAALRLAAHQRDAARRLGLDRIGDMIATPRGPLAKRFGASLITRMDQAIGRIAEPFDALRPFTLPQADLRFAEPIGNADGIACAMAELVTALADRLRARGLGARTVRLLCDRVDRHDQAITVGMARGTRDVRHILRLLTMKIETIDPGFGIDAMRLIAIRTEPLGAHFVEGDLSGAPVPADVAALVDQIVTRVGARAVYRSSAVESDVPERSVGRIAPLDEPVAWPEPWPRPVRMLRRPERLDGVMALLPDQPPRRFVWRGITHVVTHADGPERITGEWWKRASEAYAIRDYFRLENERGERFWVFRRGDGEDGRTGDLSWHMHGLFG